LVFLQKLLKKISIGQEKEYNQNFNIYMAKLVAMVRVKDGILFVHDWLEVMEKLVDEIVVVDNGSTDGTLEILKTHPKVVDISETKGFDEGRDKIMVYEMARKRNPDWCIWLDIDEIFEDRITRNHINSLMDNKKYTKYLFRRFDFVNDYSHFFFYYKSLSHNYGFSRTMWKEQKTGFFNNILIHNGDIQGIIGKTKRLNFRIKHFGYVNKQYVEKKTFMYIDVDPGRKEMYLKHFAKVPGKILKWHEFENSPNYVRMQLFIYNSIHLALRTMSGIVKILKSKTN